MKAQILLKPGILELKDVPVPICKEHEVLVKIKTSCICNGSDPAILAGVHWEAYPVVLGHEACGEIIELGRNVKSFKTGDRVSWWFSMGAFAEYVCVDPDKVAMVKLPGCISDDEGPLFELAAAAARAVEAAEIKEGSKVLIIGLGPSGLIMSQWARNLGAEMVIGWDLYEMRRAAGLKLGCGKVMDNGSRDIVRETLNETGGVDIAIDAFGNDILPGMPTLDNAIKVLKTHGRIVSYGHPQDRRMIDTFEFQKKCIRMLGPVNEIEKVRSYMEKAVEFFVEGRLDVKTLLSGRVPLEKVQDGMRLVVEHPGKYIKILVDI